MSDADDAEDAGTVESDDEAVVIQLVDQLERVLLATIARYTGRLEDAGPRFKRFLVLHALVDLTGQLMRDAITDNAEDARPRCKAMLDQVEFHISSAADRRH